MYLFVAGGFVTAGLAAWIISQIRATRSLVISIPPGPKGHWFHGNAIPPLSWRKFHEYTKQYGPVFSLYLKRQLLIVIGSYDAAWEIMEKHGGALADRPRSIAAGETLSGGKRILLVPVGERLKKLRRALHAQMQPRVAANYESIQARGANRVVLDILENPDDFQIHAKRYAASVIITITYGKQAPSSYSDPEVQQIQKYLTQLGQAMIPGKYAVDSYPILRYFPGYLKALQDHHAGELALFKSQYLAVQEDVKRGTAAPSFARYLIENEQEYGLTDEEAAYLCGSMFGAGSDTTASAIMVIIMAAACFPDAQKTAQEQLDLVIGRDRVPGFQDMDDLPYINAFILESYRWRPVSAGGFIHRATEDIVYRGMRIPKGASVVGNHWAIFRDPAVFPDPETFRPERWLDDGGRVREDLKNFNFGFGRRVCPGQHVANRSVFINTANILWAFRMRQDERTPIDTLRFTNTANSHPLPFKVNFANRFDGMPRIVHSVTAF